MVVPLVVGRCPATTVRGGQSREAGCRLPRGPGNLSRTRSTACGAGSTAGGRPRRDFRYRKSLSGVGVEVAEQGLADVPHVLDLLRAELVEQVGTDAGDVHRGRRLERGEPVV